MPRLLSILFSSALVLGGSAVNAWACSPPEGVSIQAAANIRISYPADGAVVSATSLDVLLVIEGDGEAAGLDHIHLQLDDGDNHTLPDLTGVFRLDGLTEGEHTLTFYMAEATHIPINGKKTSKFTVSSTGLKISDPESGALIRKSDIDLRYRALGRILPEFEHYRFLLDETLTIDETDLDGTLRLSGLADGIHSVTGTMVSSEGAAFGRTDALSFEVRSDLSMDNAKTAATRIKIGKLDQALKLLKRMSRSGSFNPADPDLTKKNVKKVIRLAGVDQLPKRAIKLLKKMSDGT